MRKEELKISKELKEGLHQALDKKAPEGIFSSVMQKIENNKTVLNPIHESSFQIIGAITVLLTGLFLLLPSELLEKYNLPHVSFTRFSLPHISPIFWWSLMAICVVLYADIIFYRIKKKSH